MCEIEQKYLICSLHNLRFLRQKLYTLCSPFGRKPIKARQIIFFNNGQLKAEW